jgi:hypothetical protein
MLRFTIRDMLFVTVVVGLACGWWLDHRRAGLEIGRLREHLMRHIHWTPAGRGTHGHRIKNAVFLSILQREMAIHCDAGLR